MAFAIRNLSVLAYANRFTFWHYKSATDSMALITAPNYMADASDMLTVGDRIMVQAADGSCDRVVTAADVETAVLSPLS